MSPSSSRTESAAPRLCRETENAVARAFALAYLLTADSRQAEAAVSEAVDCWNPGADSKQALVLFSVVAAARLVRRGRGFSRRRVEVSRLPRELALVADFDAPSRACFVLRILMGLPLSVCAEMLGISAGEAQEYLCATLCEMPNRHESEQESW